MTLESFQRVEFHEWRSRVIVWWKQDIQPVSITNSRIQNLRSSVCIPCPAISNKVAYYDGIVIILKSIQVSLQDKFLSQNLRIRILIYDESFQIRGYSSQENRRSARREYARRNIDRRDRFRARRIPRALVKRKSSHEHWSNVCFYPGKYRYQIRR